MSHPVDAIVAELIVQGVDKYEREFARATAVNQRFGRSIRDLQGLGAAAPPQYGGKMAQAAEKGAVAHERAAERIKRTRKASADAGIVQDEREVRSAKASAKAKADAEITEAQRSARIRATVERGVAAAGVKAGTGSRIGATVAREGGGAQRFMGATSAGAIATANVAPEREINHLLADRFDLQQRVASASGDERRELAGQLDYLRRIGTYQRAGLSDTQAVARAEREVAAIERLRVTNNEKLARQSAAEMRRNSGRLGSGLRTAAAGLVGAFSIREVSLLNDAYIKLQNQLRIAGLEGEGLERVQARLFASANKGGVEIVQLARLYTNLSSLQKDLGITQQQTLTITDAVANAIKVQGTSAESANGAILGLMQAFSQGTVQASEYNQIVEGMRPILQAAVEGSDRFKGSLGALRAEILAGKVTSRELFELIERGAKILEVQAGKAALTTAQGFTALKNALTVYFGEADKANGVSAALGAALKAIADNLDTLLPAVAAITVALGVRYVAGAVSAAAATGTLGASLLLAMGNPVVLAIAAVAGGLTYLALTANAASDATAQLLRQQTGLAAVQEKVRDAIDRVTVATGKARAESIENAKAIRAETQQYYENARAALVAARAKAMQAKQNLAAKLSENADPRTAGGFANAWAGAGSAYGGVGLSTGNPAVSQAQKENEQAQAAFRVAEETYDKAGYEITRLERMIKNPPPIYEPPAVPGKKDRRGRERQGPDPAEVQARFDSELRRLNAEYLQDQLSIATDAKKRLELQRRLTDLEYQERVAAVQNEKDYTAEQKARLIDQLNDRFGKLEGIGTSISPLERAQNKEYDDKIGELRARALQDQQQTLRAEAELVDSRTARLAIERRILSLAQEEERARLETSIAAGDIEDATIARANLARRQTAERAGLERNSESPLDAYVRRVSKSSDEISDAVEGYVVDELQEVRDGITGALEKAIGVKDPLIRGLLNLLVEQVVMRPLAEALGGALGGLGGGGGLLGSIVGGLGSLAGAVFGGGINVLGVTAGAGVSLAGSGGWASGVGGDALGFGQFGARASGGNVVAGVPYLVGEHGPEPVVFGASGRVFPNGAMRQAMQGGSGGTTIIAPQHYDLTGVVMTEDLVRGLREDNRRYANMVAAKAATGAVAAAPGRLQKLETLGS